MGAGAIRDGTAAAADLAAAHRALVAEGRVQLRLPPADPPPVTPEWLKALGRWLEWAFTPVGRLLRWIGGLMPDAPWARIVLWSALALLAAVLIAFVYQRIRHGEWRLPRRRRQVVQAAPGEADEWVPEAVQSRAWLAEADALAAAGRFAEAAHHLLLRSVEDIARRRPRLVRPALTSRELAAADGVPAGARGLFAGIAALVERSLFGGDVVGPADWQRARDAYAQFAGAGAWR